MVYLQLAWSMQAPCESKSSAEGKVHVAKGRASPDLIELAYILHAGAACASPY